eukprot:snap_masked-scaffold_70-processed-gene-0.29-mRNA-1 protein AED:1.00 eAED:1.00 QI:0/0/0/0/1/1/2/0/372
MDAKELLKGYFTLDKEEDFVRWKFMINDSLEAPGEVYKTVLAGVRSNVVLNREQTQEISMIDTEQRILIVKYLGSKYFPLVTGATSSHEIFTALKLHFNKNSKINLHVTQKNLSALRIKDSNVFKFMDTFAQNIDDNKLFKLLFQKLPSHLSGLFNDLWSDAAIRKDGKQNFTTVSNTIKLYTASADNHDTKIQQNKIKNKPSTFKKWYNICKKNGNLTRKHKNPENNDKEYIKKKNVNVARGNTSDSSRKCIDSDVDSVHSAVVKMANHSTSDLSFSKFIIDSGAAVHIVTTNKDITNYKPYVLKLDTLKNGGDIYSRGYDTLKLTLDNGKRLTVKKVYVVPEANDNILSLKRLVTSGFQMVASKHNTVLM